MIYWHFMGLAIPESTLMEKRDAIKYLCELQLKGLWSHPKPAVE